MTFTARRSTRLDRGEQGYALVMVLGIGMLLMILISTALAFSTSGLKKSREDQDSAGALAAAYAGVDEYKSRLLADSTYWKVGNEASAFTIATGSSVDLPPESESNPAFGVGSGGTWADVVGSNGTAGFRYEVDNSKLGESGVLRIRSTGKVGNETRSIVANLKAKGFIDFLYFTDYEIQDPALNLDKDGNPVCKNLKYEWQTETPKRSGCTGITFGEDDTIDGPAHSNDTMHVCGSTFEGKVTSAMPKSPYFANTTAGDTDKCATPTWNGGKPVNDTTVRMPASNQSMWRETRADLPDEVARPGCLYTGPTKITFLDDGRMTVYSPWTKYVHAGAEPPASGVILPSCGTPSAVGAQTGLGAVGGQTINVPDNNLIFVQGIPGDDKDPNYWSPTALPKNLACKGADGKATGNGLGFPTSKTVSEKVYSETAPYSSSYGCRNGDAFVQGTLKGRVTVATANYLYVTGNIVYKDTSVDMLGLVGGKAIWVWNPMYEDKDDNKILINRTSGGYPLDRKIQAAILSVENTFQVQNYNVGSKRGTLTVYGAIAQKFRGIVAQSGGYNKAYSYDDRFLNTAPPKFLAPVATTYGVTTLADVGDAFTADGSCALASPGVCR